MKARFLSSIAAPLTGAAIMVSLISGVAPAADALAAGVGDRPGYTIPQIPVEQIKFSGTVPG